MSLNKETIRLKIRNKLYLPLTKNLRRKKLKFEDFTIISNNCWAGTIYESYGIKKMSPTVGMFIMPEDYLELINNLNYYLKQPLEFIKPEDSKWKHKLGGKSNWEKYLIGKIDKIELQMLHYHDEEIAKSKWEARIERINWNKIIYKFNDQNGATLTNIEKFMQLPLKHKVCFVSEPKFRDCIGVIYIKQKKEYKKGIKASKEPFGENKYFNITEYINSINN